MPRLLPDRSFQERNLTVTALVGLVVLVVAFLLVFNAGSLPVIGRGTTYHATFGEAAGLQEGDEVRVAGVKVGQVTGMELDGDTIVVDFTVDGTWVGDQSSASIAVKTLLGQKYLALTSSGRDELDAGGTIPLDRTTTPYDVTSTLSTLATTVGDIDTAQLQQSFEALSGAFENTPAAVRGTLDGLTALSRTVSSRDAELAQLLDNTRQVSEVLRDRRGEIGTLVQDGNLLLDELAQRRETISALLRGTADLGTQLQGLVKDNQARLAPALERLDQVSQILSDNQANLDKTVRLLGPYYRVLTSALGNGPWLDTYVCGLFDTRQAPELRNDVARNCAPPAGGRS